MKISGLKNQKIREKVRLAASVWQTEDFEGMCLVVWNLSNNLRQKNFRFHVTWLVKIAIYEKLFFGHSKASVCQTRPNWTDSLVWLNFSESTLSLGIKFGEKKIFDRAMGAPLNLSESCYKRKLTWAFNSQQKPVVVKWLDVLIGVFVKWSNVICVKYNSNSRIRCWKPFILLYKMINVA